MIDGVSMANDAYMHRAIELAREGVAQGRGGPFGAVVVKDGVVVGEGSNEVLATQDPTCHAEVVAIRDACRRLGSFSLAGCELYASSEPCPMCLGAIYWSRMDKVCFANGRDVAASYGFSDEFIYDEFAKLPSARELTMVRVPMGGSEEPFAAWERKHAAHY